MDKEDMVHMNNGILLSYKKAWNIAICSNMDGPRDDHTKWVKQKNTDMILLTCGIWKNDANELIYKI